MLHANGQTEAAHRVFTALRESAPEPATVADFDAAVYEAQALLAEGRPNEAIAVALRFSDEAPRFAAMFAPNGIRWATQLAQAYALTGKDNEAQAVLDRLRGFKLRFNGDPFASFDYALALAGVRQAQERQQEAWDLLRPHVQAADFTPAVFDRSYLEAQIRAAQLLLALGQPGAALASAEAAQAHLKQQRTGKHPFLFAELLAAQGAAMLASGQNEAGAKTLREALALMRAHHDQGSEATSEAERLLRKAEATRKLGSAT
jgi:tetratricopeptide (TPR) repeat protein